MTSTPQYPPQTSRPANSPAPPAFSSAPPRAPETAAPQQPPPPPTPAPPGPARRRWTAGGITSIVFGCLGLCLSLSLLAAGGAIGLVDILRNGQEFTVSDGTTLRSAGYAVAVEDFHVGGIGVVEEDRDLLPALRLRVSENASGQPTFVGIAPAQDARTFLTGMAYGSVDDFDRGSTATVEHAGAAPTQQPAEFGLWRHSAVMAPGQALDWQLESGDWTVVVMNDDASRGVDVATRIEVSMPALVARVVYWSLVGAGIVLLAVSIAFIVVPVRAANRRAG